MMSSQINIVIIFLALLTGGGKCQDSGTCGQNRDVCNMKRNNALEMGSAQLKCSGMEQYLACVRDDIKDCSQKSNRDQYALNMVKTYCNKAYICSDRLMQCYKDFTSTIMQNITSADNKTRAHLCTTLVTPIMKCQEKVTADCGNQTGLLETVAAQQRSLNSACGNTVPCLGMMLQCFSTILTITSEAKTGTGNVTVQSADCSSQTGLDYCGAYRDALSCARANVSKCSDKFSVDNFIATLDNTTTTVCNSNTTCGQKISTCLCHVNSQTSTSIVTSVCSIFAPFEQCLNGLSPECHSNPYTSQQMSSLTATYRGYYRQYCTTDGGNCPEAIQCLTHLSSIDMAQFTYNGRSPSLGIGPLCLVAGPMLRCLEGSNARCGHTPGKVTFSMIESSMLSMCTEIGPHIHTISKCPDFAKCIKGFELQHIGLMAESDSPSQQAEVERKMFLGLTNTSFWCSYLTHGFQCISQTATACSLSQEFAAETNQQYLNMQKVCRGPQPTTTEATGPEVRVTLLPSKDGPGSKSSGGDKTDDGRGGASLPQAAIHCTILGMMIWTVLIH